MSDWTISEALGFRNGLIDGIADINETVRLGADYVQGLKEGVTEIADSVRRLPNASVSELALITENLAERIEHLTNGSLEQVVFAVDRMRRNVQVLEGRMPCEDGVRNFAGDPDSVSHDDCVNAESVVLTDWSDSEDIKAAGFVRMSDLADWFYKVVEEARLSDLIDTAKRECNEGVFDVFEEF